MVALPPWQVSLVLLHSVAPSRAPKVIAVLVDTITLYNNESLFALTNPHNSKRIQQCPRLDALYVLLVRFVRQNKAPLALDNSRP